LTPASGLSSIKEVPSVPNLVVSSSVFVHTSLTAYTILNCCVTVSVTL
jgi:hypothetical protein